jgi:hypothetical protein
VADRGEHLVVLAQIFACIVRALAGDSTIERLLEFPEPPRGVGEYQVKTEDAHKTTWCPDISEDAAPVFVAREPEWLHETNEEARPPREQGPIIGELKIALALDRMLRDDDDVIVLRGVREDLVHVLPECEMVGQLLESVEKQLRALLQREYVEIECSDEFECTIKVPINEPDIPRVDFHERSLLCTAPGAEFFAREALEFKCHESGQRFAGRKTARADKLIAR